MDQTLLTFGEKLGIPGLIILCTFYILKEANGVISPAIADVIRAVAPAITGFVHAHTVKLSAIESKIDTGFEQVKGALAVSLEKAQGDICEEFRKVVPPARAPLVSAGGSIL
jgi:hypothetical protein